VKLSIKEALAGIAVIAVLVSNMVIVSKLGGSDDFGRTTKIKNDLNITGALSIDGATTLSASTTVANTLTVENDIVLNGLTIVPDHMQFAAATKTSCASAPASTSTLADLLVRSDATTTEAERILSIHKNGTQFGTSSASTELASSTIGGTKAFSIGKDASTTVWGDEAGDQFDPAAREAAIGNGVYGPNDYVVVTQDSSNLDDGAHSISGECSFLWLQI